MTLFQRYLYTNNSCIIIMNTRSIRTNVTLFNSFLIDNTFSDIICFTETWLNELDSAVYNGRSLLFSSYS